MVVSSRTEIICPILKPDVPSYVIYNILNILTFSISQCFYAFSSCLCYFMSPLNCRPLKTWLFFFLFIVSSLQSSYFTSLRKKPIFANMKKRKSIERGTHFLSPLYPLPLVSRLLFRHDHPCFWGDWLTLVFFGSLAQATSFLSGREAGKGVGSQSIILTGGCWFLVFQTFMVGRLLLNPSEQYQLLLSSKACSVDWRILLLSCFFV